MFATLSGGEKFTKLDLQQAYLQLQLEEESRKYVTINTHRGLFEYTRLPFSVASAPALFQRVMDSILQGIPSAKCYIDDILIIGANDEDHLQNLEQVLQRLETVGMRLKKSKCQFLKPSVEYLGHRVDSTDLHPTEDKLKAVAEAPPPRNLKELRSFLGLLNYYGSFIRNLSTLLHPLNSLLQKGTKWKWSADCQKAFDSAKKSLTSSSVLVHYDPSLPIRVAACNILPRDFFSTSVARNILLQVNWGTLTTLIAAGSVPFKVFAVLSADSIDSAMFTAVCMQCQFLFSEEAPLRRLAS